MKTYRRSTLFISTTTLLDDQIGSILPDQPPAILDRDQFRELHTPNSALGAEAGPPASVPDTPAAIRRAMVLQLVDGTAGDLVRPTQLGLTRP